MLCKSSVELIKIILSQNEIIINQIFPGNINIEFDKEKIKFQEIITLLEKYGFEIIEDSEKILVEKIKIAIKELIHEMNNVDSILRKSEYLVEKLGINYRTLSKIFSENEPLTLEKYIILNKIERVKHLIDNNEFTLSEIAYMMDYSSVQYLSNQFKKETGMSVSEYKISDRSSKNFLEDLK